MLYFINQCNYHYCYIYYLYNILLYVASLIKIKVLTLTLIMRKVIMVLLTPELKDSKTGIQLMAI